MNNNFDYNKRIIIATIISTILMVAWLKYYGSKTLPSDYNKAANKAEQQYQQEQEQQEIIEQKLSIAEEEILNEDNTLNIEENTKDNIEDNTEENIDEDKTNILNIDTQKLKGSINLKGLVFDNLILEDYNKELGSTEKVELLAPKNSKNAYYITFNWKSKNNIKLPDANTLWKTNRETLSINNPVILTYDNEEGVIFQLMLSIDDNYMFTVEQNVINNTQNDIIISLDNKISKKIGFDSEQPLGVHEGFIGSFNDTIEEIKYTKLKKKSYNFDKKVSWAGFTDKYWLVSLAISRTDDNLFNVNTNYNDDIYSLDFESSDLMINANTKEGLNNYLFTGPKILNLLDQYGFQYDLVYFDRAVDFGWLYFLTKPIYIILRGFYNFLGNFGLAILLLTLVVKMAMYPFTKKSLVSMTKIKLLQPKINVIKNRYSNDKMKMNMEIMNLYKKENVSPLSGCLPMFVQIPVFLALYKVLVISIDMRQAPFFGYIKDLSVADPTTIWNLFGLLPYQINFLHIGFLPCLMAFTMWLQQKMTSSSSNTPEEMQTAMKIMPIIFLITFAGMPAGLLIYWIFSNIISILQQLFVEKKILKDLKNK